MELLIIASLSIFMGVVLLMMGLSYVAQGLDVLKFNGSTDQNSYDYYENPLNKLNSKYFHYRPKGTVIVSKRAWGKIEENIGLRIDRATKLGKALGRKDTIEEIRQRVKQDRYEMTPSSPYLLLGVKSTDSLDSIEMTALKLMHDYASVNFKHLDPAFLELAQIKHKEIVKAWDKIKCGVGEKGGKS